MSYRKSSRNQSFTVIYNEVAQHETTSMEARGLLLFMLSLPDDWAYHRKWLQEKCPGWGREKLSKILKELENLGFLIRTAKRSEDGKKLAGWEWEVLAESALKPDERVSRHSDIKVRQNSTKPVERVSRHSENQSDCQVAPTKETSITKEKTTTTTTEKIELSVFVGEVKDFMKTSGVDAWYIESRSTEIWGRYGIPSVATTVGIIWKDWRAMQ